jgi:hypothetical protein
LISLAKNIAEIIGKVGSVARRVELTSGMNIDEEHAGLGDLVVFEVVDEGGHSAELELSSGRITTPSRGDIVLGAVGSRRAIAKLISSIPREGLEIYKGKELVLLNRGGLVGKVDELAQKVGLTTVKCLGIVKLEGKVVNIRDFRLPFPSVISKLPPLVVIAGTNMEVGKTEVCCNLIRTMKKSGLRICGAKLTGIASLRDILRLQDAGAFKVADFVDAGLANTLDGKNVRDSAGIVLNYLASLEPDVIIVELGGSIMLGAPVLLSYEELRRHFSSVILATSEVAAAYGGVEVLKRFHGLTVDAIGGPVANTSYFRNAVKKFSGVDAYDFRDPDQTNTFVSEIVGRFAHSK